MSKHTVISGADLDAMNEQQFAAHLRAFLEKAYPGEWRRPVVLRVRGTDERRWLKQLNSHGLRAPGLPREHGGMGLSLDKQLVYKAVFDAYGAARVLDVGGTLLAPVLIRYGTPAQKGHYLPRILSCEDMWCQGYSEPGAGSDLASLRTSAERRGDVFVINGQKIWTSHATTASHIFVLARTGKFEKKQQGISFILCDMQTPGITVRPIVNMAGDDEFCEVFFDNVEVPVENLVGELDQGWTVAKSLLGTERLINGSPVLAQQTFDYLLRMLKSSPDMRLAAVADQRLAQIACDLHDAGALYKEICASALANTAEDADYSVLKVLSTELFQRTADLVTDLANERGGSAGECDFGDWQLDLHRLSMIARPGTIYGGTNEIQRDILSRAMFSAGR
ncbi:acyl-CoA dehydrogenase family protein [Hydrogenophaga sp. BPS33]|uniref:acyl-CoA dehydrogenase family protein n=1 Tax=Hydrogenophaga sp. BPS33 TaxID=2651974 RepID=UPI0013204D6C|nr:acyl-CoA dehydrogenase family protein [Hydrogenophaga sp. BPS33]QHE84795.1 acyl-CoA dehydrogenase [Hydrogenophaga sp. BPS33]